MACSSNEARATVFRDLATVIGIVLAVIGVLLAFGGPARLNTNPSSPLFIGTQHPFLYRMFIGFGMVFLGFATLMIFFDILHAKEQKGKKAKKGKTK
jgi:uncharacterized membrane protein